MSNKKGSAHADAPFFILVKAWLFLVAAFDLHDLAVLFVAAPSGLGEFDDAQANIRGTTDFAFAANRSDEVGIGIHPIRAAIERQLRPALVLLPGDLLF